jgi:hypothetical protein
MQLKPNDLCLQNRPFEECELRADSFDQTVAASQKGRFQDCTKRDFSRSMEL